MIKKSLIVGMAILFFGVLVANASADYEKLEEKIEELSQALHNLEGMVKDLSFQVQQTQAIANIVKEFSFELKQTESAVRDLQALGKKVEELQPRLLTLEGTIQGVAASFNEKFKVFQGRVFDLETTVQGLDARLGAVEGKVRQLLALEEQLKQLEKRVQGLEKQVAQQMPPDGPRLEALRMELMGQILELSDRLQALEENVNAMMSDLSDQVSQNRSRIISMGVNKAGVDEVDELRARIAQLEHQLQIEAKGIKSQTNTNMVIASLGLVASLVSLAVILGVITL